MDLNVDLHVTIEMARSHNWNFGYCGNLVRNVVFTETWCSGLFRVSNFKQRLRKFCYSVDDI